MERNSNTVITVLQNPEAYLLQLQKNFTVHLQHTTTKYLQWWLKAKTNFELKDTIILELYDTNCIDVSTLLELSPLQSNDNAIKFSNHYFSYTYIQYNWSSLTVGFLITRPGPRTAELLWFTSTRVSHEKGAIVRSKDVTNLLLWSFVNIWRNE